MKRKRLLERLMALKYPHHATWEVRRYVISEGTELTNEKGESVRVSQVISPTIVGDTPTIIVKPVSQ